MIAASLGEIAACVVRVPCEVVKQRAQHRPHLSISSIISQSLKNEGIGGLYRGYLSTIFRELPFSLIQYPVWELLKRGLEKNNRRYGTTPDGKLTAGQFALCGALAGAIAGGCTTPLDVIKTRIMLAEKDTVLASGKVFTAMKVIYTESGLAGLFAGVVQRILLLSVGGAIFLGFYDIASRFWSRKLR